LLVTAERLHDVPFAPPADRESISRDDIERRASSATSICSPAATVALLIPLVFLVIFAGYRAAASSTARGVMAPHPGTMSSPQRATRVGRH
jgi:hypothetical protein